jgi:hypothetical protein
LWLMVMGYGTGTYGSIYGYPCDLVSRQSF